MKNISKTKEGLMAYTAYWEWMDSGKGSFDQVAEAVLKDKFEKLTILKEEESLVLKKSNECLNDIRNLLKESNGIVDKNIKWWYKERDKSLIQLSKIRTEINKEKAKL